MPRLTTEEALAIARLARIALSPEDAARLAHELERILQHVEELTALAELAELAEQPPPGPPLRADQPGASLSQREVLDAAPRTERGHFVVPPVIE